MDSTRTPMDRRAFLRLCGYSSLALLLPGASAFAGDAPAKPAAPAFAWKRALILIELRGGNDGLNTIVPYADPAYAKARPAIAIPAEQVLKLDQQFGFNPALAPLMPAWTDKDLAIIHGVGYEHPNRSHFRGIEIWNGGTRADEMAGDGWAARVLAKADQAEAAPAELLAHAIIMGYGTTTAYGGFGPLYGQGLRNIIMNAPEGFIAQARNVKAADEATSNPALKQLLKVEADIAASGQRMQDLVAKAPDPKGDFPRTQLGGYAKSVAKLIAAGAVVPIYKLTLDGFDTHAGQRERQDKLLAELAGTIAALRSSLIAAGAWDRALILTYSEFGRRVAENGSRGTDHGTAAAHLALGGKVAGGHLGVPPSLTRLDDGDLAHSVDFRGIYAGIAQQWWGWKQPFLSEKKVKALDFLKG